MRVIMDANVGLPMEMLNLARLANLPLVVFSTTSIYKYRGGRRLETDEVHPHNRYVASKIAMEYGLQYDKCYILRIPFLVYTEGEHSFGKKCANWTLCEDLTIPIIYPCDVAWALGRIAGGNIPGGVYNLASEDVHLPTLLQEKFGWRGEVVKQSALQGIPCPQVDLIKANKVGLYG